MNSVTTWLQENCLQLNVSKTVGMYFTKTNKESNNPDIYVSGQSLQIVTQYKYLGLKIDSQLTFKAHIESISKKVKMNLATFRVIRNDMSTDAAKMFLNSMIFSHFNYCISSWSQASQSNKRPLEVLYKRAIKVMDKKPRHYHHCMILKKHNILNWDSFQRFADLCLFYKVLNNLAPPPLMEFICQKNSRERLTRSSTRADCVIPLRNSSFSQSAWSVKGAKEWNSMPVAVKQQTTYKTFTTHLKTCLIQKYTCQH